MDLVAIGAWLRPICIDRHFKYNSSNDTCMFCWTCRHNAVRIAATHLVKRHVFPLLSIVLFSDWEILNKLNAIASLWSITCLKFMQLFVRIGSWISWLLFKDHDAITILHRCLYRLISSVSVLPISFVHNTKVDRSSSSLLWLDSILAFTNLRVFRSTLYFMSFNRFPSRSMIVLFSSQPIKCLYIRLLLFMRNRNPTLSYICVISLLFP